MIKAMTESLQIPHYTLMDEVNMDEIISLRDKLKDLSDVKLTFIPLFMKAVTIAI